MIHGDADPNVSVENSRHAVRMLQRWGYDVQYHEMPGWAHEDLGQRLAIADWLLTHKRVSEPKTVRLRSGALEGASAYWLAVRGFERAGEVLRIEAEIVQPGMVVAVVIFGWLRLLGHRFGLVPVELGLVMNSCAM